MSEDLKKLEIEVIDRVLQYNKIPDGLLIRTDSLEESLRLKEKIEKAIAKSEELEK